AALKHFYAIDSVRGAQKVFGLFDHHIVSDKTGLLAGFPDKFAVPVSRWKSPRKAGILKHPQIEIVAESDEIGPNILAESGQDQTGLAYPRRVYVLNHPEYETDTLKPENDRDSAINPATPLPKHYFPDDNPSHAPRNT